MPAGRKSIFGVSICSFAQLLGAAFALKKKRVWSMRAENVYQW